MVNIYQNLYDIIVQYLFGNAELTSNMELITIALASIGAIFVFMIPFAVVWKVFKLIVNGWR